MKINLMSRKVIHTDLPNVFYFGYLTGFGNTNLLFPKLISSRNTMPQRVITFIVYKPEEYYR